MILVTGGAGFIGSHLAQRLEELRKNVRIIDNLSTGRQANVERLVSKFETEVIVGDVLNRNDINRAVKGCGSIYHLAANPDVQVGAIDPSLQFDQNILATYRLLEAMRSADAPEIHFASTSAVYGDPRAVPVTEDYGPLTPISLYGASKLACEALVSSYCHTFGLRGLIYRLANVVGPRGHGVVHDLILKLISNPRRLIVLGNGSQTRSYIHIDDCLNAMLTVAARSRERLDIFNVASGDSLDVASVAQIVCEVMGQSSTELEFTGGVDGGRGWKGDVKRISLSTAKIRSLGFVPKYNSAESVRIAAKALSRELRAKSQQIHESV